MQTPNYSLIKARNELDTLIRGWAMYKANESQLAQLRGIRDTINKVIDPDTRMAKLMEVDRGRPITTTA